MPSTGNKYCEARIIDLMNVIAASEALYAVMAEFPDEPQYWNEYLEAFDNALESCPGTAANYHATKGCATND